MTARQVVWLQSDAPVLRYPEVADAGASPAGTFLALADQVMAEVMADGGRIVNLASIAGIMGFHGQANYAAAKAGVIALTKVMSKELAKRGITVNAVAPGVIQTPMLGGLKAEVLAEYEKQIPVGRVGRPEEVAHAILFFACEESSYITGQTLPITGGWF